MPTDTPVVPPRARIAALAGAIVFPASYLAVDIVADAGKMPLPDAPAGEIYRYLVDHASSTALTGVMQLISVAGLAVFVHSVRRIVGSSGRARWGHVAGFAAVAAMCLSVLSAFVLAATVADMSISTASTVRTFGFITGGVAHVFALGAYVWLTRERHPARGIRLFGAIAAVPAFLSISSLLFFYGNVFILIGRLLCMVWVVVAAVAMVRAGIAERRAA
ncbi:MAG: hypothetical protein ACRDQF_10020 [Thermocrispum sp.]